MRNLSIIILLLLLSCQKSNEPESEGQIKVYSWKEYDIAASKKNGQEIIVVDTICPFELKRAESDIKNGKLIYTCYSPITDEVVKELDILLIPFGLRAKSGLHSCIVPPKGFKEYCYEQRMQKEIEKKYSQKWLDSLEKIALKNYVLKNPDQPYMENGIDLRTIYLKK